VECGGAETPHEIQRGFVEAEPPATGDLGPLEGHGGQGSGPKLEKNNKNQLKNKQLKLSEWDAR